MARMLNLSSFLFLKNRVFDIAPEAIEVFNKDDVAYFIFSEFANFMIKHTKNYEGDI